VVSAAGRVVSGFGDVVSDAEAALGPLEESTLLLGDADEFLSGLAMTSLCRYAGAGVTYDAPLRFGRSRRRVSSSAVSYNEALLSRAAFPGFGVSAAG